MDEAITRRRRAGLVQTPVAYLNCNFSGPVGGKPALFTHDDVTTLFHEFGHGLHHLLTRVDYLGVSGINGVEWDAVELPSQFMENFCWEWDVLQAATQQVETGERLPHPLFDRMYAARNFQSGMQTVRQLEFALFDLRIHSEKPDDSQGILRLLDEVRRDVAVIVPPAFNRFAHSFQHIFSGGYSAGYYSYIWAEMLDHDAFEAFKETGNPYDPATAKRLKDTIMSVGNTVDPADGYRAFRGRDPGIGALMRKRGFPVPVTPQSPAALR
jgi:oligopeptidase A